MKAAMWTVIAAAVAVMAILWYARDAMYSPIMLTTPVNMTIARGEVTGQVARKLDQLGLLRSRRIFSLWARWRGIDRSLRPGRYTFSGPTRMKDILDMLQNGRAVIVTVTIPEGWTIGRIAPYLRAELGFDADAFDKLAHDSALVRAADSPDGQLEGYLWPDTYRFYWGVDPREVVAGMLQEARAAFPDSLEARARELGMNRHEVLTLASMIEQEATAGNERSRISAVFHNRLKLGMLLQCDPTVVYAIGGLPPGRPLLEADLSFDSPYNTYLHPGLPPGPICNPGAASILAALYPEPVRDLYFVADGRGAHIFSETLAQHNSARAQIRREIRRQQQQSGNVR